ncbi:hypothetical protein CJ030_MR3G005600 [Morella rubra]|uniref:Transposase MuDR plant domain-containing protein n=1 Tax=Morella rubra TaxID=262757 RepID=A0A6A1W5D9_9ROSI|nr:hypothetical protein CJ030_MR3G005600 [Morella rubra]
MVDGLKFRDVKLFKLALKQYCIQNGFDYKYVKNDKLRVTAKCRGANCPWRIHASFTTEKEALQVKTQNAKHTCGGLLDAFDLLLPNTEHRFCLKHLHTNCKGYGWKSLPFKAELWACAKSCTEVQFKKHMEELSGIPCPHAVCAIHYTRQVPEDFVDDYFRIDAYRRAYEPIMHAMPGPEDWPKVTGHDPILPPRVKARTGRPRKVRRRGMDEPPPPGRVTRAGIPIKCGTCGVVGHNARKCKLPQRADQRIYPKKPSKKKVSTDGEGTSPAASEPTIPRHRTRAMVVKLVEVNTIGEVGRHLKIFDWELDLLNDVLS